MRLAANFDFDARAAPRRAAPAAAPCHALSAAAVDRAARRVKDLSGKAKLVETLVQAGVSPSEAAELAAEPRGRPAARVLL